MSINWYPGHMYKARKEMAKVIPQVDIIIEILDARIPFSSQNPAIAELQAKTNKPTIKILNKEDLADSKITVEWQNYLEKEVGVKTLALGLHDQGKGRRILELCKATLPGKADTPKGLKAMILGIPNVGKSTLINEMAGRAIAKTGNEPAVTKGQQSIGLGKGITLLDTPGILWPKFENERSGYRLAASRAIKDTAFNQGDIAFFLVEYLLEAYAGILFKRYQITEVPSDGKECLEQIGRRRGCLWSGNRVDIDKVSGILLNEFRAGIIGCISLETPEMIAREVIETAELRSKKLAEQEEKTRLRKRKAKQRRENK